jgi:hypothetical protein
LAIETASTRVARLGFTRAAGFHRIGGRIIVQRYAASGSITFNNIAFSGSIPLQPAKEKRLDQMPHVSSKPPMNECEGPSCQITQLSQCTRTQKVCFFPPIPFSVRIRSPDACCALTLTKKVLDACGILGQSLERRFVMAQTLSKLPPRSVDNHSFGLNDFEPLLNSHQAASSWTFITRPYKSWLGAERSTAPM